MRKIFFGYFTSCNQPDSAEFFLCSLSELGISFGHCFNNWSGNNEKINAFNNRSVLKFSVGR